MVIKLGINGFGRIGRVIFRKCLRTPDLEVTAINDPAIDAEYICYLIKFDSTHGKFAGNIFCTENEISIDGKKIKILHEKLPVNIPWVSSGVQYVVEASGVFTNIEKALGHLSSAGVKRVIVTAPSVDTPMLIMGVNENMIGIEERVLSCASSTLYCLAPIVKILEDQFGVTEGLVTSIHAMTPSLKPLDGLCLRGRHWRDHRSIHQNIIPAATGACKALNKIIPQIKDKLSGLAFRVPIVNVSVLDISIRLDKSTSIEGIVKCVHQYGHTSMRNIIRISNEEAVSSDFFGENHSCILDVNTSFNLSPNFFKLVCWYENEHSYACRVIDTVLFSERQFQTNYIPIAIESISRGTTADRCKRILVPNNYTFKINPDMVSSASQDTGFKMKLLPRTLKTGTLGVRNLLTSPTTLSQVVTKTNEALKSINKIDDVNDTQSQKNVGTLFQSCLHLGPACIAQNREIRNQQQLEKIKKEFSKVVNLTEVLLKKSSHGSNQINNNVQNNSFSEDLDEKNKSSQNNNEKQKKEKVIIEPDNEPIVHNEYKETTDVLTLNAVTASDQKSSDHTIVHNNMNATTPLQNIEIEKNSSVQFSDCNTLTEYAKSNVNSLPSISEVATSENNILDKLECGKTGGDALNLGQENIICNIVKVVNNENTLSEVNIKGSPNQKLELFDPTLITVNIPEHEKIDNKTKKNSKSTNKQMCLNKSKTITSSETNSKEIDVPEGYINDKTEKSEIKSEQITITNNLLQSNKKIVENFLHRISVNRTDLTSAGTSRCASPCLSSVCNIRSRKSKQDIYDKLDSTSGSDSENSFEEKKSQVINITDLTNSVEDLARLDKICRIIEISDELSDKLFSALNDSEGFDKKKTWSFKDLCERIKFDDFCNKIFGQ